MEINKYMIKETKEGETHYCTRCEIEANHKELEKTFPEHTCWKKEITIDTIRKAAEESNKMQKEQTEKWTMMETNKQDWEAEFDKEFGKTIREINYNIPTGVAELNIDDLLIFIKSLLSTQEEKIFKQLETIDVKMGDPDAEAKVKFAIKAMIRHIKLKNATK